MVGCYIKHAVYNKYLAVDSKGKRWTDKEKAQLYCTTVNAESIAKGIKNNPKYRNVKLLVVDKNDVELSVL